MDTGDVVDSSKGTFIGKQHLQQTVILSRNT